MKFLRIITFPLSLLYGFLVLLRNKCYDIGLFSSTEFEIPIISVGNLCHGGTGKTPHIEYLIRLLKPEFYIATLSRGYGRKTKGFILCDTQCTAQEVGDEPLQFKKKFNSVRIAVDEKRVRGIQKLKELFPSLQTILLDDAFQHRSVKPGLSIVLSDFSKLYLNDFVMPTGSLREFSSGVKRADIIIITKCPEILLPIERKRLVDDIKPLPYQHVYFSYIKYGDFIPLNMATTPLNKNFYFERNFSIILLTGIANTSPLLYYLKDRVKNIVPVKFPDHHQFNLTDIGKVKNAYDSVSSTNKIILTTEKDAMRLKDSVFSDLLGQLPIFYIPIEIDFHNKDREDFNEQIIHYVKANQKSNTTYPK